MPGRVDRPLAEALRALAAALAALPTQGMVIGGIAVIAHGVPRLTRDIDATISDVSVEDLAATLVAQGFEPRRPDALAFARQSQVLLMRHGATGVDLDFSLAWLPFEREALAARRRVEIEGVAIDLARPEDLVIYKAVARRPRDLDDARRLLVLHGDEIDLARVRRWVADFAAALDEPDRVIELETLIADAQRLRRLPP